jgi:type IV fimbrial biogenesis protein FimT
VIFKGVSHVKNSRQQSAFRIKHHLPRHARAFSLYDALVTLTVVSTVTTIAVPSFLQLISSQRMSGAVNSLVAALNLTRSETIKRGERAVLCPSPDGRACRTNSVGGTAWEEGYLLYIDRNGNHEFDADEIAVRIFSATEGLHIRSSAYRDHVSYLPNGMASGSNITFTFCDKHGRGTPRAVIVSNSGRPRTSTRDASGGAISCPAAP